MLTLLLASPAKAVTLKQVCAKAMNAYQRWYENIQAPPSRVIESNDVIVDVLDDETGTSRLVSMKQLLQSSFKLRLVKENQWVTRHWRFLGMLPDVNWVSPNPNLFFGEGSYPLGEIQVELPRSGEIKIQIIHDQKYATENVRANIQAAAEIVKNIYPQFEMTAGGTGQFNHIYLKTSSGYIPNNAFIRYFMQFAEELSTFKP